MAGSGTGGGITLAPRDGDGPLEGSGVARAMLTTLSLYDRVFALYWEAIGTFQRLFASFEIPRVDTPSTLNDDFGRLRVWAENVGAYRKGTLGLDHRLREAFSVKDMAKDLLKDLNDVLEGSE